MYKKADFYLLATQKELIIQYKNSMFGSLWFFVGPVIQMLILGVIFSRFIGLDNYFLYLIAGLIAWNFFSTTIFKSSSSYILNSDLLQKTYFPRETIPFSVVFAKAIQMIVSFGIVILTLLFLRYDLDFEIFYLIIPLAWLIILTLCISLIVSILSVIYRDLSILLQLFLSLWFYSTPVIYSLDMVASEVRVLFFLNPMVSVIDLLHLSFNVRTNLSSEMIFFNLLVTVLIFFFSKKIFHEYKHKLVDLL